MEKLKSFLKTTFFGGFLVVLPVIVLIFVLKWLYEVLIEKISPVTYLVVQTAALKNLQRFRLKTDSLWRVEGEAQP